MGGSQGGFNGGGGGATGENEAQIFFTFGQRHHRLTFRDRDARIFDVLNVSRGVLATDRGKRAARRRTALQ